MLLLVFTELETKEITDIVYHIAPRTNPNVISATDFAKLHQCRY